MRFRPRRPLALLALGAAVLAGGSCNPAGDALVVVRLEARPTIEISALSLQKLVLDETYGAIPLGFKSDGAFDWNGLDHRPISASPTTLGVVVPGDAGFVFLRAMAWRDPPPTDYFVDADYVGSSEPVGPIHPGETYFTDLVLAPPVDGGAGDAEVGAER